MVKVKVSCVSYTNSLPFVYGLENFADPSEIDLSLDTPAECYRKLSQSDIDMGLVPVVALKDIKDSQIVSPFCIGSKTEVKSVILVSKCKPTCIKKIYLDYQSRTSVKLAHVLARHYWRSAPEFINAEPGFEEMEITGDTGLVIIGDRSFSFYQKDVYITDLGKEWHNFSGKAFVFACWIATKPMDKKILERFNNALERGLENIDLVINQQREIFEKAGIDPQKYYYENINYNFDVQSREGLELFLNLMQ